MHILAESDRWNIAMSFCIWSVPMMLPIYLSSPPWSCFIYFSLQLLASVTKNVTTWEFWASSSQFFLQALSLESTKYMWYKDSGSFVTFSFFTSFLGNSLSFGLFDIPKSSSIFLDLPRCSSVGVPRSSSIFLGVPRFSSMFLGLPRCYSMFLDVLRCFSMFPMCLDHIFGGFWSSRCSSIIYLGVLVLINPLGCFLGQLCLFSPPKHVHPVTLAGFALIGGVLAPIKVLLWISNVPHIYLSVVAGANLSF